MHTPTLTKKIKLARRRSHAQEQAPHVHFHQGPQGQPTPCYDRRCANPRLSL